MVFLTLVPSSCSLISFPMIEEVQESSFIFGRKINERNEKEVQESSVVNMSEKENTNEE